MQSCNQSGNISHLKELRIAKLGGGGSRVKDNMAPDRPASLARGKRRFSLSVHRARRLLLCCLLLLLLPAATAAREVLVSRLLFQGQSGRDEVELQPGRSIELREQILLAPEAIRLRVESVDPEINLLLRFQPSDAKSGTMTLTIVLFNPRKKRDFQHERQSKVMQGGALQIRESLRLGEGLETDLGGAVGEVAEIFIDEDGTRELQLELRGEVLLLRLIPFEEGGDPSGALLPYFKRERLDFLDYDLLAGGYEENLYVEWVFLEDFALLTNYISDGTNSVLLARGVLRQQLVRWRRAAVSVEGGAAFYSLDPADASDENDGELSLAIGATLGFRYRRWGMALHAAAVDSEALVMFLGGWQFSASFGALLEWQSFKGLSDFGLGLSWKF